MINTETTLTGNDGFVQTENIVFRLYPLLDRFDITTAGLYTYLRTWRNNSAGTAYYHCVWLTREEMCLQLGIGRDKLRDQLKTLADYRLIRTKKSRARANKDVFEILEPLTEAEFRAEYPEAIATFDAGLRELAGKNEKDAQQFPAKRAAWKAEHVAPTQRKSPASIPKPAQPGTPTQDELAKLFAGTAELNAVEMVTDVRLSAIAEGNGMTPAQVLNWI